MKKYIVIALLMVLVMVYPAYARWSVGAVGGKVIAAGGYTPEWKYNANHTPTSGDPKETESNGYHVGGIIAAPTGATKITKIKSWWHDSDVATTIRMCVWSSDGNTLVGGGDGATPGTSSGFYGLEVSGLNLAVTAGNSYYVGASINGSLDMYYYATGSGYYTEDDYSASCVANLGAVTENASIVHAIAVYFE